MINPKDYLLEKLDSLVVAPKEFLGSKEALIDTIYSLLLSHKFRKYSIHDNFKLHIKNAIKLNIEAKQPINVTFLHGAYKLWRLEESPEADWAELFAIIYYSDWLKEVCSIYKPGVRFDFFVDDRIIPKMNNIDISDVEKYICSFQNILDFTKLFQPKNLHITITRVGSQFSSFEAFETLLNENIRIITNNSYSYDKKKLSMVELNCKPTIHQLHDPFWREKVLCMHDAYLLVKKSTGYHYAANKILAFSNPLPSGTVIPVGTTKSSIVKFWIGVGALGRKNNTFQEYVLSPNQILNTLTTKETIHIPGLEGKNFDTIRIFDLI